MAPHVSQNGLNSDTCITLHHRCTHELYPLWVIKLCSASCPAKKWTGHEQCAHVRSFLLSFLSGAVRCFGRANGQDEAKAVSPEHRRPKNMVKMVKKAAGTVAKGVFEGS